jgi:hypothetical protein
MSSRLRPSAAIPDSAAAQALYMAALAERIGALDPAAGAVPAAVIGDICHALAVIGAAVAAAPVYYVAGLKDGKRAAVAVMRMTEAGT